MKKYTEEQMTSDLNKWKTEVEPLVGATQLYAYPYGEWILGANCSDIRQQALIQAGFRLFCGVGESPYYTKMPLGEHQTKNTLSGPLRPRRNLPSKQSLRPPFQRPKSLRPQPPRRISL